MRKNKVVGALALMMLGASPAFAAENKAVDFQASADIENVCLIEADDVNFGQVYAPLTQQGAKSELRVLCSKNTSYTIDLNYGGNFVDPNNSGGGGYEARMTYKYTDAYEAKNNVQSAGYRIYKDGKPVGGGVSGNGSDSNYKYNLNGDNNRGDFDCNSSKPGKIGYRTKDAAVLLGNGTGSSMVLNYVDDVSGICANGRVNITSFNSLLGNFLNDKGVMTGAMKGDSLAYQITIPGDISKPWISNINSYKATASGEFDKIEVNAKIVPNSSSSLYPAQDNYFDTVTAVISY